MTDASAIPPIDNPRPADDHEMLVARIVRLEVISDNTVKALDTMQRRMDEGFNRLSAEIHSETSQFRQEMMEFRKEMMEFRKEIMELHKEMMELRKEMNANLRWLAGVQMTTVLAVLAIMARMAHFF